MERRKEKVDWKRLATGLSIAAAGCLVIGLGLWLGGAAIGSTVSVAAVGAALL